MRKMRLTRNITTTKEGLDLDKGLYYVQAHKAKGGEYLADHTEKAVTVELTEEELEQNFVEEEDIASELLRAIDEETREIFGEEQAKKWREEIDKSLEEKGLPAIDWNLD
jgi:hypothetical protein